MILINFNIIFMTHEKRQCNNKKRQRNGLNGYFDKINIKFINERINIV